MLEIILIILLVLVSLAVLALAVTNRQLQKDQRFILDESVGARKAFDELRAHDEEVLRSKREIDADVIARLVEERDNAYVSLELALKDKEETKK